MWLYVVLVRTLWSMEKVAEECYRLSEEHSKALTLPPLFFPKISDLVLWVTTNHRPRKA